MKPVAPRATLRTYSHLAGGRRLPSDYEVATTQLVAHPTRGFETDLPLGPWYRRYQAESPLACSDWERFADPRETTYARWTALQSRSEAAVDGVLESMETSRYDEALPPRAIELLAATISPLRFAVHGLQMASAYVGSMAPSGRIAIACAFQAADEIRRVQRLAYRLALLRRAHPGLGDDGRARWQSAPAWQPLREAIERLLVTWDWGEAFVALDLCIEPAFDRMIMVELSAAARARGDYQLGEILFALDADCRWHRDWAAALVAAAVADRPENRDVIARWVAAWRPLATRAAQGLATLLGEHAEDARANAARSFGEWLARLGVEGDR